MKLLKTICSRKFRIRAVMAIFPMSFTCGIAFFGLYFSYLPSHPRMRAFEFVHELSNHGRPVYISDVESTGLALLLITMMLGPALMMTFIPLGAFEDELSKPSRELKIISLLSAIMTGATIYFAGPFIANFFVFRGIILGL